ncbi:hypothetical protein, partial [Oceanobacillus massiliensis]|uniref:hypothetical protein n=1 Tax=Oceanobacillus massiliensis TaxID=1465765 RepID=UPI003017424B
MRNLQLLLFPLYFLGFNQSFQIIYGFIKIQSNIRKNSINTIPASADFRSGQSLSAGTASASSEETHFLRDLQLLLFPLE